MTVAYKFERSKAKRQSLDALREYQDYLQDTTHEDHEGMVLLPGRNYNCGGRTTDDLIAAVERMHENYIRLKDENGINKRTYDRWDEVIYNLGPGCFHTPEEQFLIERIIIATICPDAPARATWHIDPETGYDDLHIVFGSKRPNGKLTLERTDTPQLKRLTDLDQHIADLLNNAKDKPKNRRPNIKTAAQTGRENSAQIARENGKPKPQPLHVQVARLAEKEGLGDVEEHHLPGLLERLGIRIKEIIGGVIHYFSSRTSLVAKARDGSDSIRKARVIPINVRDFVNRVLEAQVDIRIARARKLAKANAQPAPPQVTGEATPEPTPTPSAEPKSTPANKTAEKAATLQAYLEDRLGRVKVSPKKRKSLREAAKDLLQSDGSIEPEFLATLTEEQQATLKPLAEAYANEIQ